MMGAGLTTKPRMARLGCVHRRAPFCCGNERLSLTFVFWRRFAHRCSTNLGPPQSLSGRAFCCREWHMSEEVIANMRARIRHVRNIIKLAHDPKMIEALQMMIVQAEADIAKLEAEQAESGARH